MNVHRQVDQQAGAEAGGALGAPRLVGVDLHRAGDVEVGPRHVADELGQEDRRRDRPAVRAADVLQVGDVGVEQLAVLVLGSGSCQTGSSVGRGRRLDLVDERLRRAEHAGHPGAERDHARAGERGDVDDGVGLLLRASASPSASTRRPSASVLWISTVVPPRIVSTSPSFIAEPDGMLSVHIR